MKMMKSLKLVGLLGVFTLAVGCAGPAEDGPDATQQAAENAIAAAKSAKKQAAAENYEWRDTGKIIKKAEAAMKKGNYAEAIKLANKATRQSENALAQKDAEMKRLQAMGVLSGSEDSADSTASGGAMSDSYEVSRGDSLWGISGKPTVYGNPYQWPLIYKANSDKIKDADLIYPGQVLGIDANPSDSARSAAIQHAKTRGSWTIGTTEESDKAYLAQ